MATAESAGAALDEAFVEQLLGGAVEAFNNHDIDRFLALMAEDVAFRHSAWPTPLRGKAELAEFYDGYLWSAFPDLRLDRADGPFLHPHAPRLSVAWRATGTHRGPIDPPGLAPSGRRVDVQVREVAAVRDGLLSEASIILDMAEFMRQLGVLPSQHGLVERAAAALQRLRIRLGRP
jgi:steroid delta-isomerase-like uncharacterized protein